MIVSLIDVERRELRQLKRQRRDDDGHVEMMVIPLVDKGRPLPRSADDLGLDEATVYRSGASSPTLA